MKVRASFLWLGLVHCSSPADKPANGTTSGSTQPADTNNATDDTNDSGGDARVWTTFAGNLTHLYGQGRPEVRDYSCQLYWTVATEAAPTVVDDCPDCDFAFAVQWTLDTILSRGSGGPCDGEQNGDFTQLSVFAAKRTFREPIPVGCWTILPERGPTAPWQRSTPPRVHSSFLSETSTSHAQRAM